MAVVTLGDVSLDQQGHVGVVEMHRPPHNYFDTALLGNLHDAFRRCDDDVDCRAIVLCAEGRSFCAGTDFSRRPEDVDDDNARAARLYAEARTLFATRTPIVAAIHGAAIGGGLGLAMVADFRVATPDARLSANFT